MKSLVMTAALAATLTTFAVEGEREDYDRTPTGGLVERPVKGSSKSISLVSRQSVFSDMELGEIVKSVRLTTQLPLALNVDDAPASVELVDNETPSTLTVYPDEFRSVLNVGNLKADNPDAKKLSERLRKQLIRALYMALGSGISPTPCYTSVVKDLKALDKLNPEFVSPDTQMHIQSAGRMGIKRVRFCDYRQACQEGWAAAPASEEQKKVWDEVHAIPNKPLQIKFDPATQKGKVTK